MILDKGFERDESADMRMCDKQHPSLRQIPCLTDEGDLDLDLDLNQ